MKHNRVTHENTSWKLHLRLFSFGRTAVGVAKLVKLILTRLFCHNLLTWCRRTKDQVSHPPAGDHCAAARALVFPASHCITIRIDSDWGLNLVLFIDTRVWDLWLVPSCRWLRPYLDRIVLQFKLIDSRSYRSQASASSDTDFFANLVFVVDFGTWHYRLTFPPSFGDHFHLTSPPWWWPRSENIT